MSTQKNIILKADQRIPVGVTALANHAKSVKQSSELLSELLQVESRSYQPISLDYNPPCFRLGENKGGGIIQDFFRPAGGQKKFPPAAGFY